MYQNLDTKYFYQTKWIDRQLDTYLPDAVSPA